MGIEGMYLNMVKAIYDKLMVNTILKDGKLSKIRNNIRMLSLTTWILMESNLLSKLSSKFLFVAVQLLSLTLCDPMDCSMPGSSVLHHLLEFAQIRVH